MRPDVALLQEAVHPPVDCANDFDCEEQGWQTGGADSSRAWRTSIVRVNPQVQLRRYTLGDLGVQDDQKLKVSLSGTLAAADVVDPASGEVFTLVSMYAPWERPHPKTSSDWIYADAAAHRLVSDLAALIGQQGQHRIIAAGDLNILHGYGENGSPYWARRYGSVFDRLDAMNLAFVGPQAPNGIQADPWPAELPETSLDVPTFHTNRQAPSTATRQLDFVFASRSIADRVHVTAMNSPDDWGPSDHCRVAIRIDS